MTHTHDQKAFGHAQALFRRPCTFMQGATKTSNLPDSALPEVAFVGRSNVGKSSLINALLNRRNLARTSKTPGRTQEINFFSLGDRLMIVDLPGYGYAKVAKSKTRDWNKTITLYLRDRIQLKRVFLLIDSRRGLKEVDQAVMGLLDEYAVSYQIVLTKLDKLVPAQRTEILRLTQEQLAPYTGAHPVVLGSSAEKKMGLIEVQIEAATFAA